MNPEIWKSGDRCFVITNKKKRQSAEYTVLSFDGRYYFLESHTGSKIKASPSRLFRSKKEAAESLEGGYHDAGANTGNGGD